MKFIISPISFNLKLKEVFMDLRKKRVLCLILGVYLVAFISSYINDVMFISRCDKRGKRDTY